MQITGLQTEARTLLNRAERMKANIFRIFVVAQFW